MPTQYVAKLAYDGTSFLGWQKTCDGPSIEETVKRALVQITQEPLVLRAASRTDRGVHALGQVIDFHLTTPIQNLSKFIYSLNSLLPSEIRCLQIIASPYLFHPTLDAVHKTYQYSISTEAIQLPLQRNTHWHIHSPLDLDLLSSASKELIGTDDFRGLCNYRKKLKENDTVRTIYSLDIQSSSSEILMFLCGNKFLYKMARNIVGTLVWIARKKIPQSALSAALSSRKRSLAGVTAPAHGLSLLNLKYKKEIFQ